MLFYQHMPIRSRSFCPLIGFAATFGFASLPPLALGKDEKIDRAIVA